MPGDPSSQRQSTISAILHDLVNQAIGRMTSIAPTPPMEHSWDVLQHNPLNDAYAIAPLQHYFTHLKLETYDGSTDPMQHMCRCTSAMYVYNALDILCC